MGGGQLNVVVFWSECFLSYVTLVRINWVQENPLFRGFRKQEAITRSNVLALTRVRRILHIAWRVRNAFFNASRLQTQYITNKAERERGTREQFFAEILKTVVSIFPMRLILDKY